MTALHMRKNQAAYVCAQGQVCVHNIMVLKLELQRVSYQDCHLHLERPPTFMLAHLIMHQQNPDSL